MLTDLALSNNPALAHTPITTALQMNIEPVRSDKIYQTLLTLPNAARDAYFREHLLHPFKQKFWQQQIPFEAKQPHGFDAIMLLGWVHRMPQELGDADRDAIVAISDDTLWQQCEETLARSLSLFTRAGITLEITHYRFTILIGKTESRVLQLGNGYSGDGGIPGYIMLSLIPNPYTLARLPAAIVHESSHNVRFQHIKWQPEKTNLADWIISEGLAESLTEHLFGAEYLGAWVTATNTTQLQTLKPVFHEKLALTGMQKMMPYLYGDEIAALQGQEPVGLPYAAGYACGYHLVQHYLKKTGQNIVQATITPTADILAATTDFWH